MTTFLRFTSKTCGPCKAQAKSIEKLAAAGKVSGTVFPFDVEADAQKAMQYHIRAVPTIVQLEDGKPVGQLVGNVPEQALAAFLAG